MCSSLGTIAGATSLSRSHTTHTVQQGLLVEVSRFLLITSTLYYLSDPSSSYPSYFNTKTFKNDIIDGSSFYDTSYNDLDCVYIDGTSQTIPLRLLICVITCLELLNLHTSQEVERWSVVGVNTRIS